MKKKMKRSSTVSHSNPLKSTKKSKQSQLGSFPGDYVLGDDPDDAAYSEGTKENEKYPTPDPSDSEAEEIIKQNLKCAKKALEYYNKKNRTNYELVKALASNAFLHDRIWLHCNFTAKPKMTPNWDGDPSTKLGSSSNTNPETRLAGDGDPSPKLFFAELFYPKPFELGVTCCRILKGKYVGCGICDSIKHPSHGYHAGGFEPYALRSYSRDY